MLTIKRLMVAGCCALCCCLNSVAQDQGGGGQTGGVPTGGDIGNLETINQETLPTQTQGQEAGGAQGVGGEEFDLQNLIDRFQIPETEPIESERIQPFVGRSIQRFNEQLLVHPRSQIVPGSGGAGGGSSRVGGAGRGAAGRGGATGNVVTVFRGDNLFRTRVRPRFEIRNRPSTQQIATSVQQRLTRIPSVARFAPGVQVAMSGRVATLTGSVQTADQRQRLERMLRLEPGVYQIRNLVQVSN